ncbi:MAG: hypothetical protein M1133_03705 [Armatimonadetes bacterium]|nr:hypothetical protein [Armatimonadota bacterium]
MSSKNKHHRMLMKMPRLEGVAPPNLLRDDFTALDAKIVLRCTHEVEELLLMQSVEGHAHEGHGLFYGKRFPNTTLDDISRSLRFDPKAVKEARQELIDEIMEFIERAVAGEEIHSACNAEGEPLMRCGALRYMEIEPHGLLQGLYMGGLRDDAEIRNLANERYGVEMGYGKCCLVDQVVLRRLGLNGFDLARQAHEQEIYEFEKAGLFALNGDPNVAYMYVRYKVGPGASDDAAVVMAGKMHGFSAAVGCFLADAVDTLEKYVPEYSDQDSDLSAYIEVNYKELGVKVDDAVTLAYLCAIPPDMQGQLPDSSLRHMFEVDRKHDQSTVESHLAYVAGRPYSEMELDHGECTNVEFYEYIERRLSDFKANGK